jgi:PAS domain S-box-containing protein
MTHLGIFSVLSGLLQLTVPGYSLRLVRRFGAQRVGWFVVLAFSALAVLYLLKPARLFVGGTSGGSNMDILFGLASALLVIGMAHVETLCRERQDSEREQTRRRAEWEQEAALRHADLTRTNKALQDELARLERTEKVLRESEAHFRSLFLEHPQPMWIFDLRSQRFLAVNKAALRHYGYTQEEFMALSAGEMMPAELGADFARDVARPCSSAEARGVWHHVRKDRTVMEVEIASLDIRHAGIPARLVVANDISSRRHQEAAVRDAERMAVIGHVAGGVAHHLNNALTVVEGHASLLQRQELDPEANEHLAQISQAADRAVNITRQLLLVGGQQTIQLAPVNLSNRVHEVNQMLRRVAGKLVEVQLNLAADVPMVLADARLVDQMLVSLVLNARDAMPLGGPLTISVSAVRLDEKQAGRHHAARAGGFVRLSVRDSGRGMTPEVRARLFEPFFTTHDIGKGMGLGLASVWGAVKQHSGWVEVTSEPGAGAEFSLFFPSAPTEVKAAVTTPVPAQVARRETVLVIEPDERARCLARFILSHKGYRVIEADSDPTALTIWESQSAQVSLVLTSLELTGTMSGQELAARLQQTNPRLKVLFAFGGGGEDVGQLPRVELAGNGFVSKPYTAAKLVQAVEAALG